MEIGKVNQLIEKLLVYGEVNDLLGDWDRVAARNQIRDILGIKESPEPALTEDDFEVPAEPQVLLDPLLDFAVEKGLIEDRVTERDLLDTRIMGAMTPRQSEIGRRFYETAEREGIRRATNEYYHFAKASNYIRQARIARDLNWKAESEYGQIEITINLSKPEKDPDEIAKAKEEPQSNYPKCYLCLENVGYPGTFSHPARQNHRVVPLKLQNEDWFLQYSPYVYYNEHCIVFHKEHIPMQIDKNTFAVLLDFIDQLPHYFIGSNADLPLVGGSILNHDHYQGGRHIFPMEEAEAEEFYQHPTFPEVEISRVKWPMSVIRLKAEVREDIINLAAKILENWRQYSDPDLDILAFSQVDGKQKAHNTITPIARKKDGVYELDLVLRNNRKSEEYPAGIFHPHADLHHIKKENIGLIEVMGRAILPGRLKTELNWISSYLSGDLELEELEAKEGLEKHLDWIAELKEEYGINLSEEEAEQVVEVEVANKFSRVLEDAGVYKNNSIGYKGFERFLASVGIEPSEL
ncbi:UTP-hexose-1-phosphate uridylyltransferase [Halanaerobium saccharolyticum]|uniref:Galactose-1-phosphate uridylyltransferase n=1 Tax=Halanaerobium saccharolyticum TaxID=43595 RepID=A0A4R6S2A3_9FIRM|nr:UDP-glucose--hexose-1-phosphate uridylyltransferase [Halanaerobium saccharolyticum]TDP92776.1 UTP-hexose-1-phosphate uridylyltransferase [Halanaerobium saccharolyticum]